MEQVKKFADKNKDLLVIAANPASDEIVVFFNGYGSFVKFPKPDKIEDGTIFRMLFDSPKFNRYANDFLVGLMKAIETDEIKGVGLCQVVAGSVQSMNKLLGVKGKKNGKTKKK